MTSAKRLSDIGEWGLLEKLKRFYPTADSRLLVGFGDDTAVIDPAPESKDYLLLTVDTLVEGTHFLVARYDPYLLGKKSVVVNLSDIAAMGGIAEFMLVSLAAPRSLPAKIIDNIYRGISAAAKEHNLLLVNGDTVKSRRLVITIFLVGKKPKAENLLLRSTARPEQRVYVTGMLGESGLGLYLLKSHPGFLRGRIEQRFVRRHLEPTARVDEGRLLARNFSDLAVIDISDGLYNELNLLKKFSRVGFEIELSAIPISQEMRRYCERKGLDPLHFALFGGEDYELLFTTTTPAAKVRELFSKNSPQTAATCIGKVTKTKKIRFLAPDGKIVSFSDRTFRHF